MKNTEKRKVYPEKRRKVFVGITSKQSFRDATGQGGSGLWTGRGKVFVAMSGGVDSSVAAMLLKNAYLDSHGRVRIAEGRRLEARYSRAYDVVGVFMRCYNVDGCQDRDAEDARRVAEYLSIPFYVWDFEEEYKKRVVEYMVEGYRAGITPNPDVMCNREIKFGLFLERALATGADFIATGHYVSLRPLSRTDVVSTPSVETHLHLASSAPTVAGDQARRSSDSFSKEGLAQWGLHEAKDKNKDQSYFLWTLTQKQLAHCLFPIGDYTKPEVRAMAKKAGLSTAEKKDSQGICFLGQVTIADFLKEYIPTKRGEVLSVAGGKIGEHDGAHFYTIGQRHIDADLKFPKTGKATERLPLYVSEKDVARNTVTLAEGDEHPALYKKEVELADVNFINPHHPYILENMRMKVLARVRYRQPLTPAVLESNHESSVISYKLIFESPKKFVAVGQSAVFYGTRGMVLGGGVIVGAK